MVTSLEVKRTLSKARLAVIGIVFFFCVILIAGGFIFFPKSSEDITEEPLAFNTLEFEEQPQIEQTDTTHSILPPDPMDPEKESQLPPDQMDTEKESQTRGEKLPVQPETTVTPGRTNEDAIDLNGSKEEDTEKSPIQTQPFETKYGTLEINCLPWAEVYIDDQYVDTTPLQSEISLEVGSHKVAFVNPDFPPYFETVTIESNQRTRIEVSLFTNVGFLDVKVHPWASIIVDGDSIDTTPMVEPIMLSAGIHTLRFENPRFGVFEEKIGIVASETLRVNRDLVELLID